MSLRQLPFADNDAGGPDAPPAPKKPRPTPPRNPAPVSSQQPLAGKDGAKAESLLKQARAEAVLELAEVSASAVKRLLKRGAAALGAKSLYDPAELSSIADTLASITATGELLGRARIRRRMTQGPAFAEDATDFSVFEEGVSLMQPNEALDYFSGLVPTLGVDARRFGKAQKRKAFTLAAATDQVVLARVQASIRRALADGDDVRATAQAIKKVLDAAGVSETNPGYAEMVARTNLMDAYNTGAERELAQVADYFPVWQYLGIADGRQGKDHAPHFDRYYPSSVPFSTVRGDRPFNCRCTSQPVSADSWEELKAGGARIAAGYDDPAAGEKAKAPAAAPDEPASRVPRAPKAAKVTPPVPARPV